MGSTSRLVNVLPCSNETNALLMLTMFIHTTMEVLTMEAKEQIAQACPEGCTSDGITGVYCGQPMAAMANTSIAIISETVDRKATQSLSTPRGNM